MQRRILSSVIVAGAIAFAAVCFHSVQEIHYLKSFFPGQFTVQEAFYASGVELVKVVIIGLPILVIMGVCIVFLRENGRGQ
jgi:hypothetical protein